MTHQLDIMCHHYALCALWSSYDWNDEEPGEPFDSWAGPEDLSDECALIFTRDCALFMVDEYTPEVAALWSPEQFGHDFWLTRNGHGAGFWDRGHGDIGRRLSDAAKVYGSVDLYTGDDGKVHCQ